MWKFIDKYDNIIVSLGIGLVTYYAGIKIGTGMLLGYLIGLLVGLNHSISRLNIEIEKWISR